MSPGWDQQGGVGKKPRQRFLLAQLLEMSSRLLGMIPSVIGGPGRKATSEGHHLSSSGPGPGLRQLFRLWSQSKNLGLEPEPGQE